ncbi:MAG: IPT/TIG domain-containing protein [Phycisphaerae bacterium]
MAAGWVRRAATWRIGMGAAIALGLGCSEGRRAAMKLDAVSKNVERYGFASVSVPFVAGPSNRFQFDLDKKASDYFDLAIKPQGAVRQLSSEALDVQVAVRANIEQSLATLAQFGRANDINAFRAAQQQSKMQKAMLESLVASNPDLKDNALVKSTLGLLDVAASQPEPTPDALPGFKPTSQPVETGPPFKKEDRLALAAVGGLSPGLNFPTGEFRISAREALIIACGDLVTQSLFKFFFDPESHKLRDYEFLFCPLTVSLQPGYETRTGYLADITVTVDLARPARTAGAAADAAGPNLEYLSSRFPYSSPPIQVAAVFPNLDAQVLDLLNSRRQLYSLAFQLAMVGFGTQANAFLDYARKFEEDARTASTLSVGTAYTAGGNSFGFRVEPRYFALRDVNGKQSDPGRRLENRSFPAMAIVLVHRAYLKGIYPYNDDERQVEMAGGADAQRAVADRQASVGAAARPKTKDPYDYLVFQCNTRWAPLERPGLCKPRRIGELQAWEQAVALDEAEQAVGQVSSAGRHERQVLALRARTLGQMLTDSQALVPVQSTGGAKSITVDSIRPAHGWVDQFTVVTVRGTGFANNIHRVTVGGIACRFEVPNDSLLLVLVPPWGMANKINLSDLTGVGPTGGPISLAPGARFTYESPPGERYSLVPQISTDGKLRTSLDAEIVVATRRDVTSSATGAEVNRVIGKISLDLETLPVTSAPSDPRNISVQRDDKGNIVGIKLGKEAPIADAVKVFDSLSATSRPAK